MQELKQIMIDYELTTDDVAKMLERKKNTVESWLSVGQSRPIPKDALKLLKLQLTAK